MILTNNSIPQFQNGLKGNTIPDTELKYFAKARFIHFTTRFRYCLFAIPGSYTREYCRSCSFYVYLVAMCARSYRRMWVRHTREANSNSNARQETLHSEPDETFNEREGWKRERERSVGMNQEKGGDSGSTLISQIHFWLVPRTVDTQPSTSTIFHIFFTRSPPPCFYFNRGSHLARKTRRHFPEMSTEKLKPSSYFNLVFPWNLRVNRETRSERSYIFYGITDFDIALISKYEIYIFIENLSDIYNIYTFKSIDN